MMDQDRPLVGLLSSAAASGAPVAFGASPAQDRDRADLLRDVFALAAALERDRGRRWLVESEDAYEIAVCLLAAAVVGARIALPPNLQTGTLRELRSQSDRVLASGPDAPAEAVDPLAAGRDAAESGRSTAADREHAPPIDRNAPLVELFTSGTSGPGKLVTKAMRHLEDEVVELEQLFGQRIARDAKIFATVSAHHLYGLLFRVLWPLAASRPFCRESFLLPDELLARVGAAEHAVVVSSPAHLRHLAASRRLEQHAARIAEIFSSGGPLEERTALAIEGAAGSAPMEIFGSTETGGVACRRASSTEPSPIWRTFPSVRVERNPDDEALSVTSPFVTIPGNHAGPQDLLATLRMGDRAELVAQGFRLLGRGDRIAKVGEKTLSLPEIESRLLEHAFVDAAVVGTYPDRSGPRLGAVIVLSPGGRTRLAEDGRRALQGVLATHLAERWDRVALPRRWRFVEALPSDARGKLAQQTFAAELAQPVRQPREPLVLAERRSGNEVVLELVVPRDLAYFDGHYDGFPLVPGAVQIHWVMLTIGRLAGRRVSAQRMEAIKFRNVLRPAQHLTMRLEIDEAFSHATFTLGHESRVFSSGRIALRH